MFWEFYLGKNGLPGKKRVYLSYSKVYKQYLFSNKSFCKVFISWAYIYSSLKIPRNNFRGNWNFYYSYLITELAENCKVNIDFNEIKEIYSFLFEFYQSLSINAQISQLI